MSTVSGSDAPRFGCGSAVVRADRTAAGVAIAWPGDSATNADGRVTAGGPQRVVRSPGAPACVA